VADQVEVRDQHGALLAAASLEGGAVRDPDGHLLVTFAPGAKQVFSLGSIVGSALLGAIGGNASPQGTTSMRNPVDAPPLNLKYVPVSLPFAQVELQQDGSAQIELLPGGRLNDKLIDRALPADATARIRASSPLHHTLDEGNTAELTDPSSRVLARAAYGSADPSTPGSSWMIDVLDNDLPAVWLFAILLACRRWHER
jgi:hypothetical protein